MKFQDNKSRKEVYAKGQEISEWKYEVVALNTQNFRAEFF
jgi:hypothetical protein